MLDYRLRASGKLPGNLLLIKTIWRYDTGGQQAESAFGLEWFL
jgi:hypothetical protein